MVKLFIDTVKKNIILYLLIFFVGNSVGNLGAYYSISRDCSFMNVFRISNIAYSCKRLAP